MPTFLTLRPLNFRLTTIFLLALVSYNLLILLCLVKIPLFIIYTLLFLPTHSGRRGQNEDSFYMYKCSKFNMPHTNEMSYDYSKTHNLNCAMITVKI